MKLLNKTFLEFYNSVINQERNLELLTAERVLFLDKSLGDNGYHKKIYNDNIFELITKKGIKIAERTYFETIFSNMANNTAEEVEKILEMVKKRNTKKINILEFCTGGGSQTFAFLRRGINVFTIEKNKQILNWTKENFQLFPQMKGRVKFYNSLLEDYFENNTVRKEVNNFLDKIDLIYADPPWETNYYKKSIFLWEDIKPYGLLIIEKGIKNAPMVCLKLPVKMPLELIYETAVRLKVHARVIEQELQLPGRKLEERVVFFIKDPNKNFPSVEIKRNKL